jgi:hypothetical protein
MKFAEEFSMPGTDELKILENWSNVAQPILRNGRTGYLAPENLAGEEEKEAWLAE